MDVNISGIDRLLRILAGASLVIATVVNALPVWGWIGVIPLITGLTGFCPLYPMLGANTKR